MAVNYFPAQSTILSPDAILSEINVRYGLQASDCRLWSTGMNDVYGVYEQNRTYFLRVSHALRFSRKDYEEELAMILQLRERNVNTCIPVKQKDDSYLWEIHAHEGKRYAVLFEEVKKDSSKNTYHQGEMAAELHRASDELELTISRRPISYHQLIEHPLRVIGEAGQLDPGAMKFIEESSAQMWNFIIKKLPQTTPYYGFCHGDMHCGNIYFVDERPQIFDFDCMGLGYRAYDLSVYLWDETSVNEQFMFSEEWKNYLNGYNEVRKLTDEEIAALPAFAALRQLWFIGLIMDSTKINNCWHGINPSFFEHQMTRFRFWHEKWMSVNS